MVTSYVSDATADLIATARLRGFATRKTLNPDRVIDLVLVRGEGTVPPQEVLIEYADRQAQRSAGDAASAVWQDGEFQSEWELEAQVGDAFALPDGAQGYIVAAPRSDGGLWRAPFKFDIGEAF